MIKMRLQYFGGRGSSGGNNPGSSSNATKAEPVEVPKTITTKNLSPELYKQVYDNPSSVPVGTTIKYEVGGVGRFQTLKYEGNGIWSYKDMSDGKRFKFTENPYIPEYEGKTAQQISEIEVRNALKEVKKRK